MTAGQLTILEGQKHYLDQVFLFQENQERLLGRSSVSHFRLDDPLVSSLHGLLFFKDGEFFIKDLLSANGIIISEKLIDTHVLEEGMQIKIGKTLFSFSFYKEAQEGKQYITGDSLDITQDTFMGEIEKSESPKNNPEKMPLGRLIKDSKDLNICRMAIKNDLITHTHIRERLNAQNSNSISQLLIEEKIINKKNVEELLQEHNFNKTFNKDVLLGKVAIENKIVSEEKVQECIELQRRYFEETSQIPRLGELMVQKGYITLQQNNKIVKALLKNKQQPT